MKNTLEYGVASWNGTAAYGGEVHIRTEADSPLAACGVKVTGTLANPLGRDLATCRHCVNAVAQAPAEVVALTETVKQTEASAA